MSKNKKNSNIILFVASIFIILILIHTVYYIQYYRIDKQYRTINGSLSVINGYNSWHILTERKAIEYFEKNSGRHEDKNFVIQLYKAFYNPDLKTSLACSWDQCLKIVHTEADSKKVIDESYETIVESIQILNKNNYTYPLYVEDLVYKYKSDPWIIVSVENVYKKLIKETYKSYTFPKDFGFIEFLNYNKKIAIFNTVYYIGLVFFLCCILIKYKKSDFINILKECIKENKMDKTIRFYITAFIVYFIFKSMSFLFSNIAFSAQEFSENIFRGPLGCVGYFLVFKSYADCILESILTVIIFETFLSKLYEKIPNSDNDINPIEQHIEPNNYVSEVAVTEYIQNEKSNKKSKRKNHAIIIIIMVMILKLINVKKEKEE